MIDTKPKNINEYLFNQALRVLREINKDHYRDPSKKKPLLEDEKETFLHLQFLLKKIPKLKSIKMIKVNLPHSLTKDNSEVCLITGDLDKKNHKAEIEPDVLHYKELLKKHKINTISEVVTLRQLRTEYKPYEAKQKLLAAYDVFLADRKIAECLPKVLGRHFFKKRKFPIQISLNTSNLKQQVEKSIACKVVYLTGRGNSCISEVAYLDMKDTEILENARAMATAFCDNVPGSWDNIKGIYMKTPLSQSIPVYISYDDPNDIDIIDEEDDNTYEVDEISTLPNKMVKVYRDGSVHTVRVKRKAECETADVNESPVNKKKKEENISDDNSDLNEDSGKMKGKSKNKKTSKESILQQEACKNVCDIEKKETEMSAEMQSKRKSRSKRKSDGNLLLLDEVSKNIANSEGKEMSAELQSKKKTRSQRKSDGNVLINEVSKNVANLKEKEMSAELQSKKKLRSRRKSDGNVLLNEVSKNVANSEEKDKQKKRKSFVK